MISLKSIPYSIIPNPKHWSISSDSVDLYDPLNLCKDNPIHRVVYGERLNTGAGVEPAFCFMRESICRGLHNGELTALPKDNDVGFVVVDKISLIEIPSVKINSRTVIL